MKETKPVSTPTLVRNFNQLIEARRHALPTIHTWNREIDNNALAQSRVDVERLFAERVVRNMAGTVDVRRERGVIFGATRLTASHVALPSGEFHDILFHFFRAGYEQAAKDLKENLEATIGVSL